MGGCVTGSQPLEVRAAKLGLGGCALWEWGVECWAGLCELPILR